MNQWKEVHQMALARNLLSRLLLSWSNQLKGISELLLDKPSEDKAFSSVKAGSHPAPHGEGTAPPVEWLEKIRSARTPVWFSHSSVGIVTPDYSNENGYQRSEMGRLHPERPRMASSKNVGIVEEENVISLEKEEDKEDLNVQDLSSMDFKTSKLLSEKPKVEASGLDSVAATSPFKLPGQKDAQTPVNEKRYPELFLMDSAMTKRQGGFQSGISKDRKTLKTGDSYNQQVTPDKSMSDCIGDRKTVTGFMERENIIGKSQFSSQYENKATQDISFSQPIFSQSNGEWPKFKKKSTQPFVESQSATDNTSNCPKWPDLSIGNLKGTFIMNDNSKEKLPDLQRGKWPNLPGQYLSPRLVGNQEDSGCWEKRKKKLLEEQKGCFWRIEFS